MRIRPFFWILLVFVCIGTLTLAATVHIPLPAQLHVQLAQHPTAETPTTLLVRVTDEQGLAVDGAQLSSQAWMTNMHMTTKTISTTPKGQGTYLVRLSLSMVGPWMVSVSMQAAGFLPVKQTLLVQVQSAPALAYLFAQPLLLQQHLGRETALMAD